MDKYERRIEALQEFSYGRSCRSEAEEILRYVSGKHDKLAPYCQEFMKAFRYDEAADHEMIRRMCTPVYNSIVKRLVGVWEFQRQQKPGSVRSGHEKADSKVRSKKASAFDQQPRNDLVRFVASRHVM